MARFAHAAAAAIVICVSLALLGAPAGATKVGPDQPFVGRVNGAFSNAAVTVICPEPSSAGGHPAAGQHLEVLFPPPVDYGVKVSVGSTGSKARKIVARFSNDASRAISLTKLGVNVSVPTTLVLPCDGRGKVTFHPVPFSKSARTSVVKVDFVNPAA
jgi:hypothetical protein